MNWRLLWKTEIATKISLIEEFQSPNLHQSECPGIECLTRACAYIMGYLSRHRLSTSNIGCNIWMGSSKTLIFTNIRTFIYIYICFDVIKWCHSFFIIWWYSHQFSRFLNIIWQFVPGLYLFNVFYSSVRYHYLTEPTIIKITNIIRIFILWFKKSYFFNF